MGGELAEDESRMSSLHVPSTSDRLWARIIDHGIVSLLLIPAFGWRAFALFASGEASFGWSDALYLALMPIAYETLAVWLLGATVGKWVFSLRVVSTRAEGAAIGFWDALTRTLVNCFSLLISYAGYSLMFFRTDRTHVGDWLAGTRVVCARERRDPSRPRPILAIFLVHVFGLFGVASAMVFLRGLEWGAHGVSVAFLNGFSG